MRKSKLEFFLGTTTGTPALTVLNSGYTNNPELALTADDWDSPLVRTNISADKPSGTGGSFADPYPNWGGKILTVEITVHAKSAYRRWQLFQNVKALTQSSAFLNIRRTQEFPEDSVKVIDWLNDCYFTDVSPLVYADRQSARFGMVLTSKNPDTTAPTTSAL